MAALLGDARDFLGHIYRAGSQTIRRGLARKILSEQYVRFRVPAERHDFLSIKNLGKPAHIRRRGWYTTATDSEGPTEELVVESWPPALQRTEKSAR